MSEGLFSRMRNFLTLGSTRPQTAEQQPFNPLADPESIIPMQDLAVRLKLIEDIRQRHEGFLLGYGGAPFHFTTVNLSLLLLVSLDDLRELLENLEYLFCQYRVDSTQLYTLIRGEAPILERDEYEDMIQVYAPNMEEREECLSRDQRTCILTKIACPEVDACHILPFAISASEENASRFRFMSLPLRAVAGKYPTNWLCANISSSLGFLDKSWNMLCLHPTILSLWTECLCGIKCLGIVDGEDGQSIVQLQFHWMPRNGLDPAGKVKPPYDGVIHQMLQSVAAIRDDKIDMLSDEERASILGLENGQMFQVLLEREDAVKMKMVLDMKWALTRLVALSGFDVAQRCFQNDLDSYSDSGLSYESMSEDLEM